jgi:hypothetical protein
LAGIRKNPRGLNTSRSRAFAGIDATRERLASSAVELTREEKRLLRDPDWIDEDEADTIIAMRIERQQGDSAVPLEEYLKKRGLRLER